VAPLINALALHASPSAAQALIDLVKTSKSADVRKQAMNRLARLRDPQALAFLKDVLTRQATVRTPSTRT
jgi:HEAT repeat protein